MQRDETRDERLVCRLTALPREIEPPRDLWHGIEARIEAHGSRSHARTTSWVVWAGAAATLAVLLLVAVPAVRMWLAPSEAPPSGFVSSPVTPGSLDSFTTLAWQARQEDGVFVTRQALEMALGTARETGCLPSEAMAGIEDGLRALDLAIGETRAALDENPASPRLRLLLAHRYQQEAALLHRVRSL